MRRFTIIALSLYVSGCAGTFDAMYRALPSVNNCQNVKYERTNFNTVRIEADCFVPMKNDPLLELPVPTP